MVPPTGFHDFVPDFALWSGLAASTNSFKALALLPLNFILWFLLPKHLRGVGSSWESC